MHQRFASLLVAVALTACGTELDDASEGEDEAWEPAEKAAPPAAEPYRAPERSDCAPHYIKLKNGFVMQIPVECTWEGIDQGDPPPEKQQHEPFEDPTSELLWSA